MARVSVPCREFRRSFRLVLAFSGVTWGEGEGEESLAPSLGS